MQMGVVDLGGSVGAMLYRRNFIYYPVRCLRFSLYIAFGALRWKATEYPLRRELYVAASNKTRQMLVTEPRH